MIRRSKYKHITLFVVIVGCFLLFIEGQYINSSGQRPKDADFWITLLKDNNNSIRMGAARMLGMLGDGKAVPYLSSSLIEDSNLWVRIESAIALGAIKDAAAVDPLILALNSSNPPVRREAATALGRIGDQRAVSHLIERLRRDNNRLVRIRIIEALGILNDKQAIKAIFPYLEDTDMWVRRVCFQALCRLQGTSKI